MGRSTNGRCLWSFVVSAAVFASPAYAVRFDERGRLELLAPDRSQIALLAGYEATFGVVADLREPMAEDDDWIVVSSTAGFEPGDVVEVRNEYQLARANLPAAHRCRIVERTERAVRVDDPPKSPLLREKQGAHVLKQRPVVVDRFEVEPLAAGPGGGWRLTGAKEGVEVELDVTPHPGPPTVEILSRRRFSESVRVITERLRFARLPPLREVYRKNRELETGVLFQRSYNVDREGALFWDGADRGLYVYGPREISSLSLECPSAAFGLTGDGAFKAPPYDPMAAVTGDLLSYALAAPPDGDDVVIDARLAGETEVGGLRLLWYRPERKPVRVRALVPSAGGRWKPFLDCELASSDRQLDILCAPEPVRTREVRVELTPSPKHRAVLLRMLDLLVGPDGFELYAVLDDHRDHRYCRFLDPEQRTPEMEDMTMEARSTTPRAAGAEAISELVVHPGPPPRVRPRLSHVPGAARAMLIWTEHADRASLESHRAAYFGRSDIASADRATGGFVGHGIPVTKSVFVDNPKGVPCSRSHRVPQAALRSDPEFAELCRELAERGHEICVHAPHPGNSPPAAGPDAADFIAREFGSSTWIDHSARIVHLAMSGQGLNRRSPYYMGDAWRKTGHRWFWQFACEDASEQRIGSINVQQVRLGDRLHTPLWWRHAGETEDFVSWPTIRGGDLDVYTDEEIDELVQDRGVCITHTYPAAHYDDPARTQYLTVVDGEALCTSDRFEAVLERFERRIAAGDLVALTVREALEYWEGLEGLRVCPAADGTTMIVNSREADVEGLTVAVNGTVSPESDLAVRVGGAEADTLVSFRLPGRSMAHLARTGPDGGVHLTLHPIGP